MTNLKTRVQSLSKGSPDKLSTSIVALMKEMSWTVKDLQETPISSFIIVGHELVNLAKEEKKQMKKGK